MGDIFNIAAGEDFLAALVGGVAERYSNLPPEDIARLRIFLPTVRSCLKLREIFPSLWPSGALLLPKILPLGETSELSLELLETGQNIEIPPTIAGFTRQAMLADMIRRKSAAAEILNITPARTMAMAESLIKLMDEAARNELSWHILPNLVDAEYAEHWQITHSFLNEIISSWRQLIKSRNLLEPVAARNIWLHRLAESWQSKPDERVIIAGSTGSQKATRRLMQECLKLQHGHIILPGFDSSSAQYSPLPATHPQYAINSLLHELDRTPDQVAEWTGHENISNKSHWIGQLMLPAAATDEWHNKNWPNPTGVTLIESASIEDEARIIAMLLKEALHNKVKTAALVTPNRGLARRVAAELSIFGIECNDSAGVKLSATPPATLLRLLAELPFASNKVNILMAILKHPLTDLGMSKPACRHLARQLEIQHLRKKRINDLAAAIDAISDNEFSSALSNAIKPWLAIAENSKNNFSKLAEAHLSAAQRLSSSLFAEPYQSSMQSWLQDWRREENLAIDDFNGALLAAMDMIVFRPSYNQHPRIAIFSPMEARLLNFDHFILGGMNEGIWPASPAGDSWMNRNMRKRFGLPDVEQSIGQSAHDVANLLATNRVTLTRSTREDGADTIASRWWQRIEALNAMTPDKATADDTAKWRSWLETAKPPSVMLTEPRPKPPENVRPVKLSISDIEKLLRDPYAFYARHVLKLKPLDELEEDPSAADFGSLVHESFDAAITANTELWPEIEKRLAEFNRGLTAEYWRPRLKLIATKFSEWHQQRKQECKEIISEFKMETTLQIADKNFIIHGRADRVELLADGSVRIIDYKTKFKTPETKDLASLKEPQLPLEAWLLLRSPPAGWHIKGDISLEYWHLRGKAEDAIKPLLLSGREIAREVEAKLIRLLGIYDNPATAYLASPASKSAKDAYDYAHLERLKEWRFG